MRDLYILAASLCGFDTNNVREEVLRLIGTFSAKTSVKPVIIHPANLSLGSVDAETSAYVGAFGMEKDQALWRSWGRTRFDLIAVIGASPRDDFQEIAAACFLDAREKRHVDVQGEMIDLMVWQNDFRPDFRPAPVTIRRLDPEIQLDYIRRVHKRLATDLVTYGFGRPISFEARHPETSIYREHQLARDLAQLTAGLQDEAYEAPFSVVSLMDGSIVQSADYHRAFANFVAAIPEATDALEVGCGSGFLSCHLAARGQYRRVLGTDSSPTRIASARLHADLTGSSAQFECMSMAALQIADKSVDLTVSSYALEQSGADLGQVIGELCRVTRKYIVLFEPTSQYFSTLPGMWHIASNGWADSYYAALNGLNYAVRPNLFCQYYNPSAVFVIDLTGRENPMRSLAHLFGARIDDWPGGVRFE